MNEETTLPVFAGKRMSRIDSERSETANDPGFWAIYYQRKFHTT